MRVAEETRAVDASRPDRPRSVVPIVLVGLLAAAFMAVIGRTFEGASGYDTWGGYILAPILVGITVPFFARQAVREGDPRLLWLLVFALIVKLIGALVRYHVATGLYSKADAIGYDGVGTKLAERFSHGDFQLSNVYLGEGLNRPLVFSGTSFISILTGIVYTLIGPSIVGGFFFFSWLGFLGLFCFYRAFVIALPDGRRRHYAFMLFFLPSLVFWPSSIGKESWMMFTLGIAALGAAHLYTGRIARGFGLIAIGLWWAAFPRPHVAGLMVLGIAAGLLLRRKNASSRRAVPALARFLSLAVMGVLATLLVMNAERYIRQDGIELGQGIGAASQAVGDRTAGGGADFQAPVFDSPSKAPLAIATVLFRPTIPEAHNAQALIAALEGTFLLLYSVFRIRWLVGAIRSLRRRPYIAFALVYVMLFIVAFSSVSNFAILTRERVQLFPLYLALFAVPRLSKAVNSRTNGRPT